MPKMPNISQTANITVKSMVDMARTRFAPGPVPCAGTTVPGVPVLMFGYFLSRSLVPTASHPRTRLREGVGATASRLRYTTYGRNR